MQPINLILLLAVIILAAAVIVLVVTRPKVVTLSDDYPRKCNGISKVMKLSNEIAPFIYAENGKVKLQVVQKK